MPRVNVRQSVNFDAASIVGNYDSNVTDLSYLSGNGDLWLGVKADFRRLNRTDMGLLQHPHGKP